MQDFTPEDITSRDSNLSTYLYDLERPGGILDRNAKEVQEAVYAVTSIASERDELIDLIEKHAYAHQVLGETNSEMQAIEVLREIYNDPYLLKDEYDELADRQEWLMPRFDESPEGQTFRTWKNMWDAARSMTSNEWEYQWLSQNVGGYAQSRENLGHNLASLRQLAAIREMNNPEE
jgi:hypothetical protein